MRFGTSDLGTLKAPATLGREKGLEADWRKLTDAWRMETLKEMLGEDLSGQRSGPLAELNIDGVYRAPLDRGPEDMPDPSVDLVADGLDDLATQLGA